MANDKINKLTTNSSALHRNWVKAGLALKIVKDGIEAFVSDEIRHFHKAVYEDILKRKGLHCGTSCTMCRTNDVLKWHKRCPKGICNEVRGCIERTHRFKRPAWSNTDAQQWATNSWEIAKAYMSADTYSSVSSAAETDFVGILSVIINHKNFQNNVVDNLSSNTNIFTKARQVRNSLMHSMTYQVSDQELNSYIDILITLLSDAKYLATDKHAMEAILKLKQIKNKSLCVTEEDETKLRIDIMEIRKEMQQDVIRTIPTNIELQAGNTKANQSVTQLTQVNGSKQRDDIDRQKQDRVVEKNGTEPIKQDVFQDNEKHSALRYVDKIRDIDAFQLEKEDDKNKIQEENNKIKANIQIATGTETSNINETVTNEQRMADDTKHKTSDSDLKGLQKTLIDSYKRDYLESSIAPDQDSTDIAEMLVRSRMNGEIVNSYRDIFYKDSVACKKIYVTGCAGVGKTTFCQRMLQSWCNAHADHEENYCLSNNENIMQQFSFLFYIPLRYSLFESTAEQMIETQLLHQKKSLNHLQQLLGHDEVKCLIILDGLDEWTTPVHHQSSPFVSKGIPGRNVMPNCTVLTTSRQWKIDAIKLKSNEIDNLLEVTRLDYISLTGPLIHSQQIKPFKFETDFQARYVERLRYIPVILKLLIFLLHRQKSFGETMCYIYSGMIDLMSELAGEHLQNNQAFARLQEVWSNNSEQLQHACIDGDYKWGKNSTPQLLFSLGRMVFEMLLKSNHESSLMLEKTEAKLYGLSETELETCLKVRILPQTKKLGRFESQRRSLTFLHRTMQEVLTTVHVILKSLTAGRKSELMQEKTSISTNDTIFPSIATDFNNIESLQLIKISLTHKQIEYLMSLASRRTGTKRDMLKDLICKDCDECQYQFIDS